MPCSAFELWDMATRDIIRYEDLKGGETMHVVQKGVLIGLLCLVCSCVSFPQRNTFITTLLSNIDTDWLWDIQQVFDTKKGDVVSDLVRRKLIVTTEQQQVTHSIRRTDQGYPQLVAELTADFAQNSVRALINGYILSGRVSFRLSDSSMTQEVLTSAGRVISSKEAPIEPVQVGPYCLARYAFEVMTGAVSEMILVEALYNNSGILIAVRTTFFHEYVKALSAVTTLATYGDPFVDMEPWVFQALPRIVVDPERLTVKLYVATDDREGRVEELTVEWGDGSSSRLSRPDLGRLVFRHKYRSAGAYQITIVARDTAGYHTIVRIPLQIEARTSEQSEGSQVSQGEGTIRLMGIP